MVPRLVSGVVLALVTLAVTSPVDAAPDPEQCWMDGLVLRCGADHQDPGGNPAQNVNNREDRATPTGIWTRELIDEPEVCSPGPGQIGVWYRTTLRSPSGEILQQNDQCIARGDPAAPLPEPLPPPPPPTREEVIDASTVPTPAIVASPSGRGLTGMESWFWAEASGPVTASVTLRGWTVSGTLTSDRWIWTTGDGARYETAGPGTADQPAVRHVYETKDTWPVTLAVSWSGSYTVTGWGTSFTITGLATEGTTSRSYEVVEVRGVLDDPNAEG